MDFDAASDISRKPFFSCTFRDLRRSIILWVSGFAVYILICLIVFFSYHSLPTPVSDSTTEFSEVRAKKHLDHLVRHIGTRPIGSTKNRVDTVNYIKNQLFLIQNSTKDSRMTFEQRNHFGSYKNNYWHSLGNIIVTLQGKSNTTKFLVSAHYDTVTMSPGAFDDTSGVATLLEILHVLAHSGPLENSLVVNFNNGEESGLLGAADLAKFDPLFKDIVGFINLDSTPGTKPLLFQSTGSWLDFQFNKIPRPFGSVVAQDIFNLRLINSITDFSVYILGKIPGLDFAFFDNRQIYHTIEDKSVPNGALQFLGDNILTLLRNILGTPNLKEEIKTNAESHLYFDVLNLFSVVYKKSTSFILHLFLFLGYILTFAIIFFKQNGWRRKDSSKHFHHPLFGAIMSFLKLFLASVCGIILNLLISFTLQQLSPKFYYSSIFLAVCTFVFPTLCGICMILWGFAWYESQKETRKKNPLTEFSHSIWGNAIFWFFLVAITLPASLSYGSTYLIFFPGLFVLVGLIAHHIFEYVRRQSDDREEINQSMVHHSFEQLRRKKEKKKINGDGDESEGLLDSSEDQVEDDEEESHIALLHYLFFEFHFFLIALPNLIVYELFYSFLMIMISSFSALLVGPALGFFTVLAFINFYPLAKRANSYGAISILFAVGIFSCVIIAGLWSPFLQKPWSGYIVQNVVGNDSTITITDTRQLGYLESVIKNFKVPPAKCARKNSVQACTFSAKMANVSKIFSNITKIDSADNYSIKINFSTPGSYVQNILLNSLDFEENSVEVSINTNKIQDIEFPIQFRYFFPDDSNWTIEIKLPKKPENNTLVISIDSYYDDLIYSPAIQDIISQLPKWATFVGTGTGLLSVSTQISI